MSIKKFLLSREFFKNLGLAVAIATGILFITLIWLSIYTRHGQARPVPDFYGLTIEEGQKLAKKKKLRLEIIDSVYTNIVPRGSIVEQNPSLDHKVKKNRRVFITINAFLPEKVVMPDLVGLSARQAYSVLATAGLEAGNPIYKPDLTIDFVLDQLFEGETVAAGDTIEKGSEIILVLGKGLSSRRTPVPDLVGRKLDNAKSRILGASLTLGTFNFDSSVKTGEDSINAFVYKQNPEYSEDASLQLGSAVYIWLSLDSALLPVDSTLLDLADTLLIPGESTIEFN
ncbi:MAG: PASTA domain-containing protein [Marinilabiliaceae bacterium]|jgi:beta-lactam-binding protein with PASTA domain|nr:PASTA domain-containing protein [Marinilabiliaceae bacterium]